MPTKRRILLRVDEGDQVALAARLAQAPVRTTLLHKRIEATPANELQGAVAH
jgi:hypothetical protein